MITEYQYYQVLTERDEALAKVESLTEQVASLEEVRAKEYAFKQARVEELEAEIVTLRNFAHGIKQTVELMLMNPPQEGE